MEDVETLVWFEAERGFSGTETEGAWSRGQGIISFSEGCSSCWKMRELQISRCVFPGHEGAERCGLMPVGPGRNRPPGGRDRSMRSGEVVGDIKFLDVVMMYHDGGIPVVDGGRSIGRGHPSV